MTQAFGGHSLFASLSGCVESTSRKQWASRHCRHSDVRNGGGSLKMKSNRTCPGIAVFLQDHPFLRAGLFESDAPRIVATEGGGKKMQNGAIAVRRRVRSGWQFQPLLQLFV